MRVGHATDHLKLPVVRADPSHGHRTIGTGVDEERPGRQTRPHAQRFIRGVHEDRRRIAQAPGLQRRVAIDRLLLLVEERRAVRHVEKAPPGVVVHRGIAPGQLADQVGNAPASTRAAACVVNLLDREFHERAVSAVIAVGRNRKLQDLALAHAPVVTSRPLRPRWALKRLHSPGRSPAPRSLPPPVP